ncbi:hypothetical protein U6A24_02275 [Aquimarina gracilis]|uniref:Uncharacterized protein n=1 Tax=Aquimarina gracilis TaxID=874422 RepID=A0ABU5ZQB3_9FLAO|nr:hypothetical protein [Aquimarina gracilis]MEB3344265.1 hypothetical protein [Aquimarina gracilis]
MKKVFLIVLGVFSLSLLFSLRLEDSKIIKNSAFADGTCCPEDHSFCVVDGDSAGRHYFKSSGSCNDDETDF